MPTTHARYPRICSAIVTIFLGELLEFSKINMEYFLQIIFSNGEMMLGRAKKDRRFRHEGLEHRRCAKDVFCPYAPLRVFSNESGPSCETTVFYSTVLYFCKRLVGLSGIVYVNFPLSIIGFKIFLVIYVRFLYPR